MARARNQKPPPQTFGPNGEPLCRWCQKEVKKPRRSWCSDACVQEALIRSHPSYARRKVKERDHEVCRACGTDTRAIRLELQGLAKVAVNGIRASKTLEKRFAERYGLTPKQQTDVSQARLTRAAIAKTVKENERRRANGEALLSMPRNALEVHDRDRPSLIDPKVDRLVAVVLRMKRLAKARLNRRIQELRAEGYNVKGEAWSGLLREKGRYWQADHIEAVEEGGGACALDNYQTLCTPCHKAKTREHSRRRAARRRAEKRREAAESAPELLPDP